MPAHPAWTPSAASTPLPADGPPAPAARARSRSPPHSAGPCRPAATPVGTDKHRLFFSCSSRILRGTDASCGHKHSSGRANMYPCRCKSTHLEDEPWPALDTRAREVHIQGVVPHGEGLVPVLLERVDRVRLPILVARQVAPELAHLQNPPTPSSPHNNQTHA
jgi:hypothetical protein